MSNEFHTDYSCLSRALWWAKKHGYQMPPLEQAVFDNKDSEPLRASLRRWAQGLLFDHDFAKAVFGHEDVDDYGYNFNTITMWAKQYAVEYAGQIHQVNDDRPSVTFLKAPEVDYAYNHAIDTAPTELVNVDKVVIDLKNLVGSVPFNTHRIERVEAHGGQPSWQYHLKQMAVSENPFVYINDYIDEQMKKPVTDKPNVV